MPFDHFSAIAPLYSRLTYSRIEVLREAADLPSSGLLLDVGGGTGRVAAALHGLTGGVIVTDLSFGMLRQVTAAPFRPVCGASESLPFADESFERVLMVDALHHVIDQRATAAELLRLLKPGGVIVIEEPDIRAWAVKLIAIAEKLLLMRSRFLAPEEISGLFDGQEKQVRSETGTSWIVIRKTAATIA
jgi:demethylmenaquinone methyltransferase/2-methoxy-6-polyprenyl-1,4-benzoquinol methylase